MATTDFIWENIDINTANHKSPVTFVYQVSN